MRRSFHIQHNITSFAADSALALTRGGAPLDLTDFSERIGLSDSVAVKLVMPFLRQVGLLAREGMTAAFGVRLAALREERGELIGEAIHVRLYTLHWADPQAYFSFAYAAVCDWLTERGAFTLDGDGQAELVGVVVRRAAETYGFDPAGIAFSKSSVQGAMHWLSATDPPALEGWEFRRRHAAPALAVLWAADALYRRLGVELGTRLSLDSDHQDRLSHLLLLDRDDLLRVLDATARTEGIRRVGGGPWLTLGTEGGFGHWLLLNAPCPVGACEPGEGGEDGADTLAEEAVTDDDEEEPE